MSGAESLDSLRRRIDSIDDVLGVLLAERSIVVRRIGAYRERRRDPAREDEIRRRILAIHRKYGGRYADATVFRILDALFEDAMRLQDE